MNLDLPSQSAVADLTDTALNIGRVLYGGIEAGGQQWQLCLDLARAARGDWDFPSPARDHTTPGSFARRDAFNRQNPIGTDGVVRGTAGDKTVVRVDQAAMVFPSALSGDAVMAWFYNVGWRDIATFTPVSKILTTAQELGAMAQQARGYNKFDVAYELLLGALHADPNYWEGMNEMGALLGSLHRHEEAVEYFTRALAINPRSGEVLNNRGMALRVLGRSDDALADCREAHRLLPGNDMIGLNCGAALDDMDDVDGALAITDEYIHRQPQKINALYNRSLLLLSAGRFEEGWPAFDNRLMQPAQNAHYEHFQIPRWNGESIAGKSVLIWTEQGLGDEIMTASMVPDAINAGAKVTLLVCERLVPLMRRSFPTITVDERQSLIGVDSFRREPLRAELLPKAVREGTFDYQMSQVDLGRLFRPSLDAFPEKNVFLKADRDIFPRLFPDHKTVGVTWHSGRNPRIGKLKSLNLNRLAPILKTPDVTFFCLQYGDVAADIAEIKAKCGIEIAVMPGVDQLADMDTYASLVAALDLVITVSNTTAHLAGGLGVPTWLMTPTGPGRLWYWLRGRDDSPFYPSMRLFRQPKSMNWDETIAAVAQALAQCTGV